MWYHLPASRKYSKFTKTNLQARVQSWVWKKGLLRGVLSLTLMYTQLWCTQHRLPQLVCVINWSYAALKLFDEDVIVLPSKVIYVYNVRTTY